MIIDRAIPPIENFSGSVLYTYTVTQHQLFAGMTVSGNLEQVIKSVAQNKSIRRSWVLFVL